MKEISNQKHSLKHLILYGLLLSIAVVFGYVEVLISPTIMIPGIKIGLPNIVTLLLLFTERKVVPSFLVGLLRTVIVSALFGNLSMMMYSAGGFIISYLGMLFFKKVLRLRMIFVSMAGGILHNTAQLLIACIVLSSKVLLYEMPVLFLGGWIAGILTGLVGTLIHKRFQLLYLKF